MSPFAEACYRSAVEVQRLLHTTEHAFGSTLHSKGAGGDISITYDLLAEACFVKHLAPFGRILSEEGGDIGEGEDLVILDPVDGSDNLQSQFPYYGASVALEHKGHVVVGFVCNFANGDCFVREQSGFYRRSLFDTELFEKVSINNSAKLGLFEKAAEHPDVITELINEKLKFRAPGAVALSLSYAHSVKYVLFLGKMRRYDVAAGLFLCEDLYTYVGEEIFIVSHNKDVFAKILAIFNLSDKTT